MPAKIEPCPECKCYSIVLDGGCGAWYLRCVMYGCTWRGPDIVADTRKDALKEATATC